MNTSLFLSDEVYERIEPPPNPTIKNKVQTKYKNIIKKKFHISPNITTSKSYGFKMGTFESSPPEVILQLLTSFGNKMVRTGT